MACEAYVLSHATLDWVGSGQLILIKRQKYSYNANKRNQQPSADFDAKKQMAFVLFNCLVLRKA